MIDPQFAIGLSCGAVMLGIAISSGEYLWLGCKGAFDAGGFWPWPLMKKDFYFKETIALRCFNANATIYLLFWTRAIAALLAALLLAFAHSPLVPLVAVIVLNGLLNYRVRWGGEGGDHMTSLVLLCSAASFASPRESAITLASCCFLGGQLTLAYIASGTAKLTGRVWRSGTALTKILSNHTYGNRPLASFLQQHYWLAAAINYSVIGFQVTFPLYFLLASPYCYAYLVIGVLFHLGIAIVMRLHLFIYTFVAVYPCLIVTREVLRSMIF